MRRIQRYPKDLQDLFPQFLVELTATLEQEAFSDPLGEVFMEIGLGNARRGQFFSPYNVSLMMSKMICGNTAEVIKQNGFTSVGDCCCSSGAMLIAAVQNFFEQGINYQQDILFVGQDVDRVVALMAYVQMSLIGAAGYIAIGNSLTNPVVGDVLLPAPSEGYDTWFTPLYFSPVWTQRRLWRKVAGIIGAGDDKPGD